MEKPQDKSQLVLLTLTHALICILSKLIIYLFFSILEKVPNTANQYCIKSEQLGKYVTAENGGTHIITSNRGVCQGW